MKTVRCLACLVGDIALFWAQKWRKAQTLDDLPHLQRARCSTFAAPFGCGLRVKRHWRLPVALPGLPHEISRAVDGVERYVSRTLPGLRQPRIAAHLAGACAWRSEPGLAATRRAGVALRTLPVQILLGSAPAPDRAGGRAGARVFCGLISAICPTGNRWPGTHTHCIGHSRDVAWRIVLRSSVTTA